MPRLYYDEYQELTLHLTNGKKVTAIVPAFTTNGENVGIVKVEFEKPRKLNDGQHWAKVKLNGGFTDITR